MFRNELYILSFCFISCFSAYSAEQGVTDTEILLGQSAALKGNAKLLGQELSSGTNAYLNKINRLGGVFGRKIRIISYDDSYNPVKCVNNSRKLIYEDKVFALFNYIGTPTTKAVNFYLNANNIEIPLITPFTGAEFLRNPVKKNIINLRASYYNETNALVNYFVKTLDLSEISVFYQNDSYGKAGLTGVKKALRRYGLNTVSTGTYERNTINVSTGLNKISQGDPAAIIIIGTYKPCSQFIKQYKQKNEKVEFASISFVGSYSLMNELGNAAENVIISQVVPAINAEKHSVLIEKCSQDLGHKPTFIELEGYLNARLLEIALRKAGQDLTKNKFLQAIESINQNILSFQMKFSSNDHQGSDNVFLTKIKNQQFELIEVENE